MLQIIVSHPIVARISGHIRSTIGRVGSILHTSFLAISISTAFAILAAQIPVSRPEFQSVLRVIISHPIVARISGHIRSTIGRVGSILHTSFLAISISTAFAILAAQIPVSRPVCESVCESVKADLTPPGRFPLSLESVVLSNLLINLWQPSPELFYM